MTASSVLEAKGGMVRHPVRLRTILKNLPVSLTTVIRFGAMFFSAAGLTHRRLLRMNSDGTVDPAWNPSPDGPVYELAVNH